MIPLRLLGQIEAPPAPPLPPLGPVGQAPVPPPDIPPEVLAWLQTVPPQLVLVIILSVIFMGGMIVMTLIKAIAGRFGGGAGVRELQAEVETLRQRLGELEDGQARIAELEERLDFSERILAQVQRERVPGGPS